MRGTRLCLDLGSTWIGARLMRPRGWLRPPDECVHCAVHDLGVERMSLEDGLSAAAAGIASVGARLEGARLKVRLGMAYTRVGLMYLAQGDGTRLSTATLGAYVAGWVQQTLHLQPMEQIVRWQVLRDPHYVLVSCVDRKTHAGLVTFSHEHKLKFESCLPAVMQAVHATGLPPTRTLIWTEGVGEVRESAVQLLRFVRGQLTAAWRGWVPRARPADADGELEGALRRFGARHDEPSTQEACRMHWPAAQQQPVEA